MGITETSNNGPVTNGILKSNHQVQDDPNGTKDEVIRDRPFSKENESRINEDVKDVDDGKTRAVQLQEHVQILHRTQKRSQGPPDHWESFLPFRSVKVLLVENDDSTRHIVYALLRNSGYEVIAVEDGLQAWKILEDMTNRIDLVLTEVVIPFLSGIGLLCKIMGQKTCKNIPVIMMSSHDSMSVVFNCLSKGAVDYLVKPIRKNELKNLWQHVWRKCHSSSGNGSQSGIQTENSSKSKSVEDSDYNTGSNTEDDIRSIGFNAWDGSDNGSSTQSSWTKRTIEVDSPKPMSPGNQLADPHDSTCAQIIRSRSEAIHNRWSVTAAKEYKGDKFSNMLMGKDLEIGVTRIPKLQLKKPSAEALSHIDGLPGLNSIKDPENLLKEEQGNNSDSDLKSLSADLIGSINYKCPNLECVTFGTTNLLPKVSDDKNKVIYDTEEMPCLELSLKRFSDAGDTRKSTHDRNLLRHSKLSAFSRYNSASTANQAPTGDIGSCSPPDNSLEVAKTESEQNIQSNSNQHSNSDSNNNDMGSTTNNIFNQSIVFSDKLAPISKDNCLPPSALHPMQNGHFSPVEPVLEGKSDAAVPKAMLAQGKSVDQLIQVHHYHHHHHQYYIHNVPQQQYLANHDDTPLNNMVEAASQCEACNSSGAYNDGSDCAHAFSGSASGSNHGSDGQNGSSTAFNVTGSNMDIHNRISGEGGAGGEITIGIDQNHFSQREAALNKFRQKRKERCFEKKVRYHSRKKLADQRPRVRGQFVRQVVHENRNEDKHCQPDASER